MGVAVSRADSQSFGSDKQHSLLISNAGAGDQIEAEFPHE
jgi:hypothetical protein